MKSIADIDREIAQLERQLGGLYSKRVAALEAELERAQGLIDAFTGGAAQAPEAPARVPTVTKKAKTKGRPRKQQGQVTATMQKPTPQQRELFPEQSAPATTPPKKKTTTRKAQKVRQAKKRTRTPTAVVEKRITDALKEAGLFGLSQIEIAKKTGLGYQTVVKKLKELAAVEKRGAGKEGKFYLKG